MNAVAGPLSVPGGTQGTGAYRLGRRRVYILPTRAGLGFGLTLLVMLAGAVNYNNSLAFVLVFSLASLGLVSTLHTNRNLAGLELEPGEAQPVFAGQSAQMILYVGNRRGPSRQDVTIRYRTEDEASDRAVTVDLEAGAQTRVALPVATHRRGWLAVERLQVTTRYPFGLFRAWSKPRIAVRVLVYPAPGGNPALPASAQEGAREGLFTGAGREDFSGLREYVPGDSTRSIHWKAAARDRGLPVKLFSGAAAAELSLSFDQAQGPLEARLSQLCLWLLVADGEGMRYSVTLPDRTIALGSGSAHRERTLAALALFGNGDERV
ncbi:MAG: DUF58 domain-containing protein [Gammaproteobacteria bacterium]